jgi:PleD family two-component response regulator
MPGVDGLVLTRFMRKEPRMAQVPIVIFTSLTDDKFRAYAMKEGATDVWFKDKVEYLAVPGKVDELLRQLPGTLPAEGSAPKR